MKRLPCASLVLTGVLLSGCDEVLEPDVERTVEAREETTMVQSKLACGGQAANGLPLINTRCGAPVVIYLDFDGGKYLDDDDNDGIDENTIHEGYNQSGSDPTTFDPAERQVIYDAVAKVEAWFKPWNVNVSTDPNATGARAWIIIGNDVTSDGATTCNFPNVGGACSRVEDGYADTHDSGTIVHELTHNFGPHHNTDYDQWGERIGDDYADARDPLHGMVMGGKGGVINKWTLWHGGSLEGFTDQVQGILDRLDDYGDPYLPDDDVDSSHTTARAMGTSGVRKIAKGVLERPNDTDWYSFTVPTSGNHTISVVRDVPSFVDVYVVLYAANGTTYFASEDGDPDEQPYQTVNDSFISPVYLVGGTTYKIRVRSHGDYADFGAYEVRVDPLLNGTNPIGTPMRWRARDVGLCQIPGYSYAQNGTLTIQGHGDVVDTSEDAFHYVFQTLDGDGSITARVEQVTGSNSNSEVGLMIRDGLSPQAPHVTVAASYNSTKRLLVRSTTGATSTQSFVESGGNFSPVWLRLTRSGSMFTGEVADAQAGPWRLVGTQNLSMLSTVSIGVAVARNYNYMSSGMGPARVSSVSITGNVNPQRTLNPTLAPPTISVVSESYNSVLFNLTAAPGSTSTAFEKSRDGMNFEAAGGVNSGATQFVVNGLRGAERYWFRALSVDANVRFSQPSAIKTTTTRPAPVTKVTVSNVAGRRDTRLTIDWDDTSGEAGYRVSRSSSASGPFADVSGALAPNTPMFTNTGLTPNTNYYYRVETLRDLGGGTLATSSLSEVKGRYTALPTTTGGAVTGITPTSVSMQCNSVAGATSYEIRRFTASGSTQTIQTSPTRTFTDLGRSPLQWYRYGMRGKNANTWSNDWSTFMAAMPPDTANALPAGWVYDNFGAVNAAGVAGKNSSGQFTIVASGSRLSENAGGVFAGAVEGGNGWVEARVTSLSGTIPPGGDDPYPWTQGGVMIRDSLPDDETFVAAYATVNRGLRVSYRRTLGGEIFNLEGPDVDLPVKLSVERTASSTFVVTYLDGATWRSLGTVPSITMGSNVYMGLFANAGDNQSDAMVVARFTEVQTNFSGGVYP